MKQTEKRIKEILSQDIHIPDTVENRIQDTYKRLERKSPAGPKSFKTVAAALLILCIALPAAAYASAKTDFFQAMFGNSTKKSNDVIHKEVDNGKGGLTSVTIPSKEYVPVDETEAEKVIGEWVMDDPLEKKIGSHTLTVKNFVYDKNGALMYFTLEREGGVTALSGDQETNVAKGAFFTEGSDFDFTYETEKGVHGYGNIYVDTVKSTPDKMYCSAYILWVDTLEDGDRPQLVFNTYPCPQKELTEDTGFTTEKISLTDKEPIPLKVIDWGEEGYLAYSPISLTVDMSKGSGLSEEQAQDPYYQEQLKIIYDDGNEYVISDTENNIENTGYVLGSGTYYKVMFNRLVNVDAIKEIIVGDLIFP